jgi:hypothetical protein
LLAVMDHREQKRFAEAHLRIDGRGAPQTEHSSY